MKAKVNIKNSIKSNLWLKNKFNIDIIYKKQVFKKNLDFKKSSNMLLHSLINDINYYIYNKKFPNYTSRQKSEVNDLAYLEFDVAKDNKYITLDNIDYETQKDPKFKKIKNNSKNNKFNVTNFNNSTIKLYDRYLTIDSYLDRINSYKSEKIVKFNSNDKNLNKDVIDNIGPLKIEKNVLDYLFKNTHNFFDFFLNKQKNMSNIRSVGYLSSNTLLKQIKETAEHYGGSKSIEYWTTFFSFMNEFKYKISFDYTFKNNLDIDITPDLCLYQNISEFQKRLILGRFFEHNDNINFAELANELLFMSILNNDDTRFINIDNNLKINDLSTNINLVSSLLRNQNLNEVLSNFNNEISIENTNESTFSDLINISQTSFILDKNSELIINNHKQEILKNQNSIYSRYLQSEPFLHLINNNNTDNTSKNIRSSKLFALELELAKKIIDYLIQNDSYTSFRLIYEKLIKNDIFNLYSDLRQLAMNNSMMQVRHQLGFYLFNGFIILCMWTRPTYSMVEYSIYRHVECSRIYNININKNGLFECEKDVEEFLDIINCYVYSMDREVETIKDIYDNKNTEYIKDLQLSKNLI